MHAKSIPALSRRGNKYVLIAVVGGLLTGGALAAGPYQISQKIANSSRAKLPLTAARLCALSTMMVIFFTTPT